MTKQQIIFIIASFLYLIQLSNSQNCSIPNCQYCQENSVCTNCFTGFTISDQHGTACLFDNACFQPSCVSCINDTCMNCLLGYFLDYSGECLKCPSHCIQCSQNGDCLLCYGSFTLENGVCLTNYYKGCLIPYNMLICLSCQIGQYLQSPLGYCSPCINNCVSCTNSSNCYLCQNKYFLSNISTNSTCTACNLSCENCYGNSMNCTLCNIDSYLVNNECFLCQLTLPFCITCFLPSNSTAPICSSCLIGMFILTNGSCSRCPEGCQTCTNSTTCLTCQNSLFLNFNNVCQPCGIPHCASCNNNSTCFTCQSGFTNNAVRLKNCVACPPNCFYCINPNKCLDCGNNYFYLNSTTKMCSACMDNCAKCTSQFNCQSCVSYFHVVQFDGEVKCSQCPEYCPACFYINKKLECFLFCPPGSYYLILKAVCVFCSVDNCFNCNETYMTNSCSLCNSGYYLTEQGQCNQCSEGCGICQNISICKVCANGYFYQNGQCLACSPECVSCNSTVCFSCASGFFLSSLSESQTQTQCQSCPIGCLSCVAENICSFCLPGYFLLSSTSKALLQICSPCIEPCSICSTNQTCLVCQRGFALNPLGQCTQCSGNFAFCQKGYEFECMNKFTLVVNVANSKDEIIQECLACPAGCENCKYEYKTKSLICLSCSLGQTLTITGECLQCGMTNSTEGCLLCSSSNSCDSCLPGFTLKNEKCININFEPDLSWSLIGADIGLGCLSMILIIILLIQRHNMKIKPSSISIELVVEK